MKICYLYGRYQKSCDSGKITNVKFWKLIIEGMIKHSTKTRMQAQNKMESLKKIYKNTKDANNQSGNDSHSCAYYEV